MRKGGIPASGFTLIELSIVVFILAIVAGIAIPRVRDLTAVQLSSSAARLSRTARYLSEEAALRGTVFALNFDLDRHGYWVTRLDPETGEFLLDPTLLSRPVELPADVRFTDVVLPALGEVDRGTAATFFFPEGYADGTVIHLVDHHDRECTVRIDPVLGRGEVFEGRRDFGLQG